MKTFTHFLIEAAEAKSYEFKIKIACQDFDDDAHDRLEHALKAYDLNSLSKAKHLPPADHSLDFPTHPELDVYLFTATLKLPCTDAQVRQVIGEQGRFPLACVVVTPKNSPEEIMRDLDEEMDKAKGDILTKDLEKGVNGQPQVGQKRLDSMLKELESQKMEFASKKKEPAPKTTNDLTQNNNSIMAKKGVK